MRARLRSWAETAKRDSLALYLAARDPRVPWYAKALALLVVGYAFSPIDLIPDFIPVVGYLDDLLLVPLGIVLVIRLIPREVMDDLRRDAARQLACRRPKSRTAAVVIMLLWGLVVAWLAVLLADLLAPG